MTEQGIGAAEGTADTRRRPRPMWLRAISGAVVAVLVVVASIYALRADGQPVHDVALTDGGIWVSGGRTGYWGRVNTGAHGLDLILHGAGKSGNEKNVVRPDVLQDGRNAVGVTSDRRLIAFDSRTGEPIDGEIQVPEPNYASGVDYEKPDLVAMHGNTLAVVDRVSGRVWAKRLDPKGGTPIGDLMDTGELATVGPDASITVDLSGNVMAVSADSGKVVEIPAEGDGFGTPERTDLPFEDSRAADITAVGDSWVVLDLETGKIHSEGLAKPQQLPDGSPETAGVTLTIAALQQPGPKSDVVAYQTVGRAGYTAVTDDSDHDGGDVGVISGLDEEDERQQYQRISRPVINGDCLYAAWGDGNAIRFGSACGQVQQPTTELPISGDEARRNGVAIRYNRGQLLLNDLDTGRIYDLALPGDLRIDTWPGGAARAEPEPWVPFFKDPSPSASSTTSPSATSSASKSSSKKKSSGTSTKTTTTKSTKKTG